MKKRYVSSIICHVIVIILVIMTLMPGEKPIKSPYPMLVAIVLMECAYVVSVLRNKGKLQARSDLMIIIWAFMLVWEISVTKMNLMHPVLVPAPENVFYVFYERPFEMLKGVWSSLKLLIGGTFVGVGCGLVAGLLCGWIKRLREIFHPIANVLAPIPSIVFAPYVIALMPSFRSASYVVIMLGIFWPTFLNMIIRVDSMDKGIMDSARTLQLGNLEMVFQVLLPYCFPGVVSNLKVTLTTGVMMLTFAEMMGATSGMGYFIVNYNTYGNYTNVVAGIIVVALVVTILNYVVSFLQKKLIKWKMY